MVNFIHKRFQMTLSMDYVPKKHYLQATYKMLEYDRIDILEGFDVNKTSESKECDLCHY